MIFNALLSGTEDKKLSFAILSYLANIPIVDPPASLARNVFLTMVGSEEDAIFHRCLYILTSID
jgi:hypothetical protein